MPYRPRRAASRRRHESQRRSNVTQAVLLGSVIEGVPLQIFCVGAVRVPSRHRHERCGDVTAAGPENFGDIVRWCAWQQHQR
jgi:hypothetical protein